MTDKPRKPARCFMKRISNDADPVKAAATLLEAELDSGNHFVEHWLREEYEGRFTLDADIVADALSGMVPSVLEQFCERLALRSGPYVSEAIVRALEYK